MIDSILKTAPERAVNSARLPLALYSVEALTSAGTNLLITAIFFYTHNRFQWGLKQNFLLATGQGLFYILGAMTAGKVVRRIERTRALVLVYAMMTLLPFVAYLTAGWPIGVAVLLLCYSYTSTIGWPILESLVSSGVDSRALSRRVAIYNLVWSAVSVLILAIDGTLIERWPGGIFLLPMIVHAASTITMLIVAKSNGNFTAEVALLSVEAERPRAPSPEPELLRARWLALWLSRVALPATYIVIFSIMTLLPSLGVMQQFRPATQTLVGSAWMASRWLAFLLLGLGTWWHTRPQLLLIAAVVMLLAFFGVTVRPSDLFGHGSAGVDLASMLIAQGVLGLSLGMIYSGSLYFGMVLSDGSTEHGGYHEALIGLGVMIGPGTGALAEAIRPGNVHAGIAAVGAVVCLSVIAVAATAVIGHRRDAIAG